MLLRDVVARGARAQVSAAPAGAPAGVRPVEVLAYTGGIVDVGNGPEVFDLAGVELEQDVPLLVDHDETRVAGYSTSVDIVPWTDPAAPGSPPLPAIRVLGMLLVDEDEPDGRRVAKRSDQGFPQQASVRLTVVQEEAVPAGEARLINGRTFVGPFVHDKRSRLRETSFVSMGADANTRAVALAAKSKEKQPMSDPAAAAPPPPPAPAPADDPKKDDNNAAPCVAATVAELAAAFPDHPRFAMDHALKGSSLADAQAAFNSVIAAEAKEAKAALAKLQSERLATGSKVPAVRPAGEQPAPPGPTTNARDQFRAKVREAQASGLSRDRAASRVARENPELHRQVLAQANPGKPIPAPFAGGK
jgi:hypothetical protein